MKKIAVVSIISFFLGAAVYGLFFVYLPKAKNFNSEIYNNKIQPPQAIASSPSSVPKSNDPNLNFVKVAEKVAPAVVNIVATRKLKVSFGRDYWFFQDPFEDWWRRFWGFPEEKEYEEKVAGSGFIIDSQGYIVTNNHVVNDAVEIKVTTLDGKEYRAEIKGTDSKTDIALLKIKGRNLPFVKFGDSDSIKVGEWVLAVGNPFGLSHSVTAGIVSAKGRHLERAKNVPEIHDFIQTDAAINRGNSGGPLVNLRGEVIGITSNIYSPSGGNVGIGFAIPSNMAKVVIKDLKEKGRVIRGYLGVFVQDVEAGGVKSLKLKEKAGALVAKVVPDSPADKAGVKRYDVIIEFNGVKIKDSYHLKVKVAETPPGTEVKIKIIRDGKEKVLTAVLEELESEETEGEYTPAGKKDLGMRLTPFTPRLAREYGYNFSGGLLITYVRRGSAAFDAGLKAGDVILEVNKREVNTLRDFNNILRKAKSGDVLMLYVRRGEAGEFIAYLRIP